MSRAEPSHSMTRAYARRRATRSARKDCPTLDSTKTGVDVITSMSGPRLTQLRSAADVFAVIQRIGHYGLTFVRWWFGLTYFIGGVGGLIAAPIMLAGGNAGGYYMFVGAPSSSRSGMRSIRGAGNAIVLSAEAEAHRVCDSRCAQRPDQATVAV
jgi:hypothetical protein